jgi:predicted P-loop ATPase
VREYLDSLDWDGIQRLSPWLTTYLGFDETEYANAIGRMFLISMVARVYRPGCQADYMLILESGQGAKKSSACAILSGDEWFSDAMPENLASKDASMHLRGKWLIEMAELQALNRSETAALKAFITRRVEKYRPSYGRKEVNEPRQCIFIGTTNKDAYLRDETGARRFWPVKVRTIDLEALRRDRDQLLAEAVVRFKGDERWWPGADFERSVIAPQQEARYEADAWEDLIGPYLVDKDKVLIGQVARDAVAVDSGRLGTAEQHRITKALERLGWMRGERTSAGRWWIPKAASVTQ